MLKQVQHDSMRGLKFYTFTLKKTGETIIRGTV
jgi:hypothetical protein